jgi:ATP-binding cassette subfamily B (MDR/TAP) protein 1
MKAYAQSAGYAEQALSAIKVVHTYGQELLELKNYGKYLQQAKTVGKRQAFKKGFGNTATLVLFFTFYAYTFYIGGRLRNDKVKMGNGEVYTGGAIVAIMFCILLGGFSLGQAAPHFVAL